VRQQNCHPFFAGFSLVETVGAIGLVSFSVLATIGLLSIGSETGKRAKDESSTARLAENEFQQLRSLSSSSGFWTTSPPTYTTRYYDSNFADLGTTKAASAIYQLDITFATAPVGTADLVANAEVRYPANAPTANQSVYRFTTLLNIPSP
jgi:type II secretory pathway pseudopilin PulG